MSKQELARHNNIADVKTINHLTNKCGKLAPIEYKTRRDWVGKVIYWELCNKFTFEHTNK